MSIPAKAKAGNSASSPRRPGWAPASRPLSRNPTPAPANAAFDGRYRPIQHGPGNGQRSESADLSKFREGSGKTVSARAAIAALDQTRHTLIYLADPTTGTRGIHHQVVTALGGRPAHGSATLAAQAAGLIAAEHGERGRIPALVIDEAHLLTHDQLEAIRILTNAEMDAASPLSCLLIGQPTLRRMLRLGVLAALDQRIALRYAMPAMTPEQTTGYITHHLKLAGRSDPLFSDDAVTLIHDAARGLPRAVNNLATQALVAAWAGRKSIVDEQSARAAVTEVTTD